MQTNENVQRDLDTLTARTATMSRQCRRGM